MFMKKLALIITIISFVFACQTKEKSQEQESETKTVDKGPQFNPENSDQEAIELADKVMQAHGGKEAWNNTRYIAWNFLGFRDLIWDKYTGDVRIDFPRENSTYLININDNTGKVKIGDRELSKGDSLDQYIERGKQIWVNDSYWLVFPFKFKDPGVSLTYHGQDTTLSGKDAEVISLTFEQVGFTPQNKYNAYIDPKTHMILQWDYYQNASDSAASFSNEWSDYKKYDNIYLSSGRGERSLNDIKVAQEWDKTVFEQF